MAMEEAEEIQQGEAQHGLGLVNVRRLMTLMGGHIYAENRLRGGARFVAEFEVAPED